MKTQKETQRNKVLKSTHAFAASIKKQIKLFDLKLQSTSADASLDWAWYYAS